MAEALFRKMTQQYPEFTIASAGLHAMEGLPANPNTVAVLKKRGIDLSSFQSQSVTLDLIQEAAAVFAMTREHRRELLRLYPEAQEKFFLLNASGHQGDILDPIGASMETYQHCSEIIESALKTIINTHILPLL